MRTTFLWITALLVGVLTVGNSVAWAQGNAKPDQEFRVSSVDLALTFTTEESDTTPGTSNNFWFHGGSADGAVTFFHGLGVAANFTGQHASTVAPTVNIDKIDFVAGPRYTFHVGHRHENRLFVESLLGVSHARDGLFPNSSGVNPDSTSFALQVGGGWDFAVTRSIAIRAFEADYVHTSFPNGASNTQDHLRLAFGIAYHIRTH